MVFSDGAFGLLVSFESVSLDLFDCDDSVSILSELTVFCTLTNNFVNIGSEKHNKDTAKNYSRKFSTTVTKFLTTHVVLRTSMESLLSGVHLSTKELSRSLSVASKFKILPHSLHSHVLDLQRISHQHIANLIKEPFEFEKPNSLAS